MKRLFSTLLVAVLTQLCFGQITLTQADYASVGDTILLAVDTVPTINVGSTGLQSWDFTMLQNNGLDSTVYLNPATTANGAAFLSSNLSLDKTTQIEYFTSSATEYTYDGFDGDPIDLGVNSLFVFSNTQTLMEFPATYNDASTDTAFGEMKMNSLAATSSQVDSIWVKHYSYSSSILDAYGNLTLPTGTHNTLRQSSEETSIDTVYIYVTSAFVAGFLGVPANQWVLSPVIAGVIDANPITITNYTHKWIANGKKHPLVEARVNSLGGTVISAEYQAGGAVVINTASTDVSCSGMCDGEITVTPTIGISPYSYQWDDASMQTSSTASGLCAGTYNVTVVDALNDSAFVSVMLNEPSPIIAQTTGGYVQCAGDINTGIIDITTVGGTGPFSYLWDNGETTTALTGLSLNTYALTITDANSCSNDTSFTIMNPDTLEGELLGADVLCFGESNGNAWFIAAGGVTPYAYNWSNGSTSDSSGAITAGLISVTITDNLGCATTISDIFTENDSVWYTYAQPTGNGACSGIFEMFGGQSPFNYLWSNGDTSSQSCDTLGFYSITMTDANGCSIIVDSVQIYTGIEEYKFYGVSIFPNPTTGIFTVELEDNVITNVLIQDITGKEVFSTTIEETQKTIDISHLKNGNYLLNLSNDKEILTRKLILTK